MGAAAGDAMIRSWRVGRLCFLWPHGGGGTVERKVSGFCNLVHVV
jgi:hypothetical protein